MTKQLILRSLMASYQLDTILIWIRILQFYAAKLLSEPGIKIRFKYFFIVLVKI